MKHTFKQIKTTEQFVKITTVGKTQTQTVGTFVNGKFKPIVNTKDNRAVANSFIKSLSNSNNG